MPPNRVTWAALVAVLAILAADLANGTDAAIDGNDRDKTRPSAPKVLGPRQTSNRAPTFRFRSSDRHDPVSRLRFRCAFDSRNLHPCRARFRQRLNVGRHMLRVRAVDQAGNASRVTTVSVSISAAAPTGVTTIPIAHPLGPIAVDEGAVWVENRDATVSKIDPATNAVTATIRVPYPIPGRFAGAIATGHGSVWIANASANDSVNSLTRIDAATNSVVATIPVGAAPTGIAVTPGAVWVANHHGVSLSRIDPATNSVVATIPLKSEPGFLVAAGGSVWLSELDQDRPGVYDLERLDPATATIVARTPVPARFFTFGTDGVSLFLGAIEENKIYPVDLATNQLGQPFEARTPATLAVGLGSVWSATGGLARYDPASGKLTGQWSFANSGGLAVGFDSVWVASTNGLVRIKP